MMLQRTFSALGLALSCCIAGEALAASEPRQLPDYDGRDDPATTTGDVLLWIPRVILFPAYLVTEYVIRTPLGWLISGAERAGVPAWLYDFFTFGAEHQGGIVPTAYADFDFYPSIGFYAFWNDAFFRGHDLRLRAAYGGDDWQAASFSERFYFSEVRYNRLVLEAGAERRPDYTYFGIGPETRQSALVRYGQNTQHARALFDQRLWRASSVHARLELRHVDFWLGGYEEDPRLLDEVAAERLPLPPRYLEGYTLLSSEVSAAFDTRLPRPEPGTGVRVEAFAGYAHDTQNGGSFVRYGGSVGGLLDLNQRSRVVSLSLTARFVEPLGSAVVPFPELVTLGGHEPMRGFYPGRLYDRSAAVAQLGYRWPIWMWLDGAIRMEVGNVFGEHLSGFGVERCRWSGAIGVESVSTPDNSFQLMLGMGSETFESGAKLDSFRVAFGTTSGF
jgi:hypothetical protein